MFMCALFCSESLSSFQSFAVHYRQLTLENPTSSTDSTQAPCREWCRCCRTWCGTTPSRRPVSKINWHWPPEKSIPSYQPSWLRWLNDRSSTPATLRSWPGFTRCRTRCPGIIFSVREPVYKPVGLTSLTCGHSHARCQLALTTALDSIETLNGQLPPSERLEPFVWSTGWSSASVLLQVLFGNLWINEEFSPTLSHANSCWIVVMGLWRPFHFKFASFSTMLK